MTRLERLLIATTNAGKVAEFRGLLGASPLVLDDLADKPGAPDVEEDGHSFVENASIKAGAYARHFGRWALADDSGLSVDALGGKPGIHSARWAAMHEAGAGDADNNRLLLAQMDGVADDARGARFWCALALADAEGRVMLTCQSSVEGHVMREPLGANGFGYDPLFFAADVARPMAELTADEKHAISHRGRAMRAMVELMREHGMIA